MNANKNKKLKEQLNTQSDDNKMVMEKGEDMIDIEDIRDVG